MDTTKPVYLLADSQLLFWNKNGGLFLKNLPYSTLSPRAAYVGASNGDRPEFFEIFSAAMHALGIHSQRMIQASFGREDQYFLQQADIIFLAGGDVATGWKAFQRVGLASVLTQRHAEGAILIGLSAGAIHLGQCALVENGVSENHIFSTLQIVPFAIGVHEEKAGWRTLQDLLATENGASQGIGIPTGGGLIYHPSQTIEAVRYPLHAFTYDYKERRTGKSLIYPEP